MLVLVTSHSITSVARNFLDILAKGRATSVKADKVGMCACKVVTITPVKNPQNFGFALLALSLHLLSKNE